jgi:hypothetical protein
MIEKNHGNQEIKTPPVGNVGKREEPKTCLNLDLWDYGIAMIEKREKSCESCNQANQGSDIFSVFHARSECGEKEKQNSLNLDLWD